MTAHVERPGAAWWVPERLEPELLREAVEGCKGCELHLEATHGVLGDGPVESSMMVVGEQPGAAEDACGKPFVGPAGRLLARALGDAGVDVETVYRTNAVKHFRSVPGRNGKRLHKGPSQVHVAACGPWLVAEVDMVRPRGVVLLGATAGSAVYGSGFRVGAERGRRLDWPEALRHRSTSWRPDWVLATVHPAAVLRSRQRAVDYEGLVADLRQAAGLLDP
jgi:DNA polymerase